MIKKICPAVILFLSIFTFVPSATATPTPQPTSQPRVILDQLLTGPVPALNAKDLNIPADLTPGFHELTVEVYNSKGVISTKTALFCKDLQGQLHFDNLCPDLIPKPIPPKPAKFNPYGNPDGTISFFAIAFAVCSLLLGFNRRRGEEQGDLGGADSGSLGLPKNVKGWGDRRWYINTRFFNSLDSWPKAITRGVEKISVLLARAAVDARYLRAIFGNIAWLTLPASAYFSYLGMRSIKNHALPFDRTTILILVLVGVFDALAGVLSAVIYLDFTFASGSLNSINAIFFALGFTLLFFAPALVASKFRPLHRRVKNFAGFWERMTDYVLAALLTGWVASKLVSALTGLIGFQLKIANSSKLIGICVGIAILARLLLEEIAWYLYPARLNDLHVDIREPGIFLRLRGIAFKIGVMLILAEPYIGWNRYLAGGIAIFLTPQLLSLISDKLPKAKVFAQITPSGALKIVWLGVIGLFVAASISHRSLAPKEAILFSFVILPIPSFIYSMMDLFSSNPYFDLKHPKFRYSYRSLSLIILILLVMQILGLNPIKELPKAWHNPSETWHSLTYKWWPYVQTGWKNVSHWLIVAWQHICHWSKVAWQHISNWSLTAWHNIQSLWK